MPKRADEGILRVVSTAELMEKIQALPPEKQKEVENFVAALEQDRSAIRYIDAEEAEIASARIFEENAELFKKLAQ